MNLAKNVRKLLSRCLVFRAFVLDKKVFANHALSSFRHLKIVLTYLVVLNSSIYIGVLFRI